MHNLEHYLRQIRLIAEHREKDAEKKIRKLYKTLDKDLKEFLGTQYAELAQDGKLTYEILHSKKRYARFMEEVAGHVDLCSSKAAKQIMKSVNEIYALSFDGMIDAVNQSKDYYELKANLKGIKATTPSIIKNAVSNSFLEEALKKNHASAIYDIKQNIGISLSNGDRIETTAKRLSEQINKDYNKSVLITRTETHRIREAGMQDSSEEIAKNLDDDYVMVKIWKTMKDERVRPQVRYKTKSGWKSSRSRSGADHMKMEGQTVLVDEVFDLGGGVTAKTPGQSGSAAHDCNCRCYISRDFMTRAEFEKLTGRKSSKVNEVQTPKTLESIDDYLNRYLDKEVKLSSKKVDEINEHLKKVIDKNDLCMRIPDETILERILDDGKFKTQFETNTSKGSLNHRARKKATEQLFGIKTSKLSKGDFEKYGYLGSKDKRIDFRSRYSFQDAYGGIIVTFKKENIADRTTFTIGDSLYAAATEKMLVASKITSPNAAAIHRQNLNSYYNAMKKVENMDDLISDPSKLAWALGQESYIELQFHGDLLIDDIESIAIEKESLTGSMIRRLKHLGIEVIEK